MKLQHGAGYCWEDHSREETCCESQRNGERKRKSHVEHEIGDQRAESCAEQRDQAVGTETFVGYSGGNPDSCDNRETVQRCLAKESESSECEDCRDGRAGETDLHEVDQYEADSSYQGGVQKRCADSDCGEVVYESSCVCL